MNIRINSLLLPRINKEIIYKAFSTGHVKPPASSSSSSSLSGAVPPSSADKININNVTGLSDRIVTPAKGPVGPGASETSDYKVPEYFCFHNMSYHEAEIELAKFRCPQPSALKK